MRERLHAHLMLALYRQRRQADALTAFAKLRRLIHVMCMVASCSM
ncbi:MAG: BTAD domain-containing putative transcriptional regulator [Actinophytocola sp.]